jgi:amino acid adenylation domain-containing protein
LSPSTFSCFLIGEGTLLIRCAEIIVQQGHQIIGIFSPDKVISKWANEKNISYFQASKNLGELLIEESCDYLFSIVNHEILPQEILSLPRQQAINYHDALLPKYAGVNATSWALINQEQQHGITWHIMSELVDAGDILKQVKIEIEPEETALTLNTKCYEAAIASFAELIDELASNTVKATKQNLEERTYFPLTQQPDAGGILSFNRCAYELDALVRGLDFGNYNNPLSTAKLILKSKVKTESNDYVIVSKVKILETRSSKPPGTIIALAEGETSVRACDELRIATASYDISLQKIKTIDGEPLSISELVSRFCLQVGYQLPQIEADTAKKIEKFASLVAKEERFWRKRLANLQPVIIPDAEKRELLRSLQKRYARVEIPLPKKVMSLLEQSYSPWQLGKFFLAAFAVYLTRISRTNSFTLGIYQTEWRSTLADLEGLFASFLPFQVKIEDKQSFTTVFAAVAQQVELIKQRKTYARDIVVRYPELNRLQTRKGEPLFSVSVVWTDNSNESDIEVSGSHLTLAINQKDKKCSWLYNSDVLADDIILRMSSQFTTLLEGIATNPTSPIAYLPLLSQQEREKILFEWNDTQKDYPQDKCIHHLFEEQVDSNSDRLAVIFNQQKLTYQELNCRANQLARYLQKLGVKPEMLIGICLERSLEMVIALLGILKAGAVYVPLDPSYPQERLNYMLSDAEVSILLTQEHLVKRLPPSSAKFIRLDRDWNLIAREAKTTPASRVKPDNLAYVIYTSGSTGKPKGVAIEHGSVLNTLLDINHRFHINSEDRVLALSSLSFDLSVYDIFGLLGAGGTVVIPHPDSSPNPEHWLELIKQERVTVWNSAPALMEIWVNHLTSQAKNIPDSLRLVLLSGDRIPPSLPLQLQEMNDKLQVISLGGATEASIWSIFYPIDHSHSQSLSIPYGRPLSNQQFYVLDTYQQPVPIGVPGELYIGGVGLARGYLHRPQLTQDKFIPNPFLDEAPLSKGGKGGSSLYKTGDLGRYLSDGKIEFLGRLDNQVKIRGYRIELGEIENVLAQYPGVRDTAVISREDFPGDKRLVAYLVFYQKQKLTNQELRRFLQEKLPDYMIPSAFVILNCLPLTPNGKVDRRALPSPDRIRLEAQAHSLAPRDNLELQLTKIWERVLGIKPISIKDNFFDLGGHSLLAVRLFSQIEQVFKIKLPLATLFQAPTIEQLASLLKDEGLSASWSSLVNIQPNGSKPPFFCVHAVGGNVLSYRLLAQALGSDQPFYGLQVQGLDGKQQPYTCVEDIAAHYIQEIQLIQPEGPYFLGGHSFGGFVAFEMAQQLNQQGQKVAFLVLFDCLGPNYVDKNTFSHWLSIHLTNLAHLQGTEKLSYLWLRLQWLLEQKIPKPIAETYFSLTDIFRSPQELLLRRIADTNRQAQKNYIPAVYPGKLTLFRAQVRRTNGYFDPYGGWSQLALGGIEVYELPGDHMSFLIKESHLKIFAQQLKDCLTKAQSISYCCESVANTKFKNAGDKLSQLGVLSYAPTYK